MNKPKVLSGDELVARGALKRDTSLPEIGLKDVLPNGSWLEQKQIQSALEARKHLIEVERIDKCGSLSHAIWREDLMLAQVTQQTGGHWQYLGHHIEKELFLNPEEALFLIEVNCLLLKYNGVTVTLQQAYSLLLRSKITLLHYKVYASLSRLGYKLLRYEEDTDSLVENTSNERHENGVEINGENKAQSNLDVEKAENNISYEMEVDSADSATLSKNSGTELNSKNEDNTIAQNNINIPVCSNVQADETEFKTSETLKNKESSESNVMQLDSENCKKLPSASSGVPIYKLQLLEKRTNKPLNTKHKETFFEQVPEFTDKQIVTLTVPKEEHIPRNVFLNNITYVLNLEAIKSKTKHVRPDSVEPRPYSASEEVNGDHIRRIKGSSNSGYNGSPLSSSRFRPNIQFRPNVWRPNNMNFFPFNVFFQRTFMNFQTPRFHSFVPRPSLLGMCPRFTNFSQNVEEINVIENTRKRKNNQRDNAKQVHLRAIKSLAVRIKQLVQSGYIQTKNVEALQKLIETFNHSYNMNLRITDGYEIVNAENIVDTICLDDEESSSTKKAKNDEDYNYAENFKRLKQMALKLKNLDSKGEINSRHRRALSNVIKRFNKSYSADVYLTDNFEIKDRKFISLDSSSDSDCVIEETPKATKGKKLKNPFSILKRLQEKNFTTANATRELLSEIKDNKYSTEMRENFGNSWLPDEHDFGRAEVLPKTITNTYLIHAKREEFFFDFMKSQPIEFDSWLDVKIAFLRNLEETCKISRIPANSDEESCLKCLIGPEDCMDTSSVLKKLSIIRTENECDTKSSFAIDFDVYNRDVQNFRKTNLPKPHFRIICIDESSNFPSGKDIATLHSKLDDNIPVVFAIVGVGSISYLQINSVDIPVYISSNDLT